MKILICAILVITLLVSNCFAIDSIQKRNLIDNRISLMHQVEDIDKLLDEIQKQKITDEDNKKLEYYKEYLEKDNPMPEDYKGIQREEIKSEET